MVTLVQSVGTNGKSVASMTELTLLHNTLNNYALYISILPYESATYDYKQGMLKRLDDMHKEVYSFLMLITAKSRIPGRAEQMFLWLDSVKTNFNGIIEQLKEQMRSKNATSR